MAFLAGAPNVLRVYQASQWGRRKETMGTTKNMLSRLRQAKLFFSILWRPYETWHISLPVAWEIAFVIMNRKFEVGDKQETGPNVRQQGKR